MKGTITITATDDGKQTHLDSKGSLEHISRKDKMILFRTFLNLLEISTEEAEAFLILVKLGIADTLSRPVTPTETPEPPTNNHDTN